MKKPYFLLLLLFATIFSFSQEKFQPKELRGSEANAIWQGAEHIWLKQENSVPAFIEFRSGSEPDESTFFIILKKQFLLPSSYTFKQIGFEKDNMGWQHKRYQLTVNNVPVNSGIFLLHLMNGKVKKYNGYLFLKADIHTGASLSESSALTFALKDVNARVYKWQLPDEEKFLKEETGNASSTFFPKGELEIVQIGKTTSNIFRLAWKFDIYAHQPISRQYIYIDAQTGEVLKRSNRIHEANTNGTAITAYRGSRPIVADSYNGAYRLYETTRGLGIRTRNMQTGTSYTAAVEFTDADNVWNNVNANLDQYAGDAHWGAEKTYDFYQTMGRNSINNAGLLLNLYVHYDDGYFNAFWDGTRMTFGDGNGSPLTTLDITGHEISHGLTEYTSGLDYQDESGALNESFSDIFGTAVEWYADSTQANWLIGEDLGGAFRSMSNPNGYGDPDTYTGTNWYTGTGDNGGVHTNSSVQNHWYYRLSVGGSGTNDLGNAFSVQAIGRTKATQIAWRNDVNYLSNFSDYADARFYAIQSANDLFGSCSQEVVSTTKAWYAVGVGADYVAGADAQFTPSVVTSCTVPATITFTNQSTNASSYLWYFGDGTTSTATSPSHIYAANGIYTVKLVAIGGGTCGSDSITYPNLINVNVANPCQVILPTSGSYPTQTSCTGTIYDSGGPNGDYTGNTSSTVTISPIGASNVKLHFTQLDLENNYDFVYVYDGPNTTSPIIGSFTGNTIPADVTSTGSSITVRQYSDPYVEGAGFTIQWTCTLPVVTPVANFKADATQSCTGAIQFTDLTTGGANAWSWNFGDGNTSTLQHPLHVYQTNGVFTVSLTATNNFGNNTATKNNYITVSKPAGPAAGNSSSCGAQSFSLTANTTNPVSWFDNTGTVVSNANPFITPVLNTTATYFVQDTQSQPIRKVGPVSNTAVGVTGSNFNNNVTLGCVFNVFKKSVLVSVLVYATGDGYRTIQYRDSIGGVISQRSVFIPNGTSRVTLNMDLQVGNAFLLRLKDTTNLYRNQGGAVYPYNDAGGIVRITGNNSTAPTNYYYFYDWEVKEADCISLQSAVTLTIKPAITATSTFTNVSCFGGTNGSVSVAPAGGTPNFSYLWSNSANTATISNVPAGLYLVTVTDAVGCTTLSSQTVSEPSALNVSQVHSDILCHGAATGTTGVVVSGGTVSYSYNWGGGITTPVRTSLTAGTYMVTVTDANSCTATSSATIIEPAAINVTATPVNASCGLQNGSISTNVSGGTGGFNYLWNQGQTSSSLSNLSVGNYSVTVTDDNSCSASIAATVGSSSALNANTSSVAASCFGSADGGADITVINGAQPITYIWSNGMTAPNIINVPSGDYTVTATDGAGCSVTASQTVSEPTALNINVQSTNAACNQNNGSITVNPSGGTAGYSYLWGSGEITSSLSNLSPGDYTVTISDSHSCSAETSITIINASSLTATVSVNDVTCHAAATGSVTVNVTTGTPPYTFVWNNGGDSSMVDHLMAGNYFVTITDGVGCVHSDSMVIAQPASFSVNTTLTNISCFRSADGSATVSVTGATPAYSYLWCNGSTTSLASNLSAGNCSVTISDANGCNTISTALITEPGELQNTASVADATTGMSNGSVDITVSGGTFPYSIQWSNGGDGTNLSAGTYFFTITDNNGCTITDSAVVNEVTGLNQINEELSFRVYPNPASDAIFVVMKEKKDKISVSLKDVLGQTLFTQSISTAVTAIDLSVFSAGVYLLEVKQTEKKSVKEIVISR